MLGTWFEFNKSWLLLTLTADWYIMKLKEYTSNNKKEIEILYQIVAFSNHYSNVC